ncbi:MAG: hypothetical protein EHM45_07350 [Desulfobacteraceae bacterium]|nr:MAG: hypothetical protein EHM45_07350 [Desulfobacteraceae bacterium]
MIRKNHIIGSLIIFMVCLGFIVAQTAYSQNSAGNEKPSNQAQQAPPTIKTATPSPEYYLTLEKIYLVKNRIHIILKNTGAEKVPAQAYTGGKLTLKSNSFDKKWTLADMDPGQALNKAAKSVDFDTQLTLTVLETVKVSLVNVKGDRNKQVNLSPALTLGQKPKSAGGNKPQIINSPPPVAHLGSESLIPAGVHSEGIVITSPRMGDRFVPGNTLVVRFTLRPNEATYGTVPTTFRIILYDESTANRTYRIYDGPAREFSYVIPADMPQSDKFKVYVAGNDNLHYYCTTGHFSIKRLSLDAAAAPAPGSVELAPYLYLNKPEAYATWNKGCSYTVEWRSNVGPRTAVISLVQAPTGSEFNTTTVSSVNRLSEGVYSASYFIPNSPDLPASGASYGYRVKVTVQDAGKSASATGEALKIQTPYLNVESPDGSFTVCPGQTVPITWSYAGCRDKTFRITLLTDLPLNIAPRVLHHGVAFAPTTTVGGYLFQQTYSWTAPADLREGTYRIMVETNPSSFGETRITGTGRQFMKHDCD